MYTLTVFDNSQYGKLEVIVKEGKEYFEAIKVANILGYTNPHDAINRHCEITGVVFHEVRVETGKKANGDIATKIVSKKFIDEGNLYRLILRSRMKNAKKFGSWVVNEVLSSIRKHGAYINDNNLEQILNNPDILIKLAQNLKKEKEKVENLTNVIKYYDPYIKIGKTVSECDDGISIGAFAKLINGLGVKIGRNRLFAWFRNHGYIMKQCGENQPKQQYIDKGLFKTRQVVINTESGPKLRVTTYITGKGQNYFIKQIQGGI